MSRTAATIVALMLAGCQRHTSPPPRFDGPEAFAYIGMQLAFGPRTPGSSAHAGMAHWLDSMARVRSDSVVVQDWKHVTAGGARFPLRNVLLRFTPSLPTRVLYVAHWDTRPKADSKMSRDSTLPVPGANDGASGVALLLGVADALRRQPVGVGVDLLFVDGEDWGDFADSTQTLLGARYYAAHPVPPAPAFVVIWDMVADREQRFFQEGNSLLAAPDVVERVWRAAAERGLASTFVATPGNAIIDDHLPFHQIGWKAIDVIDLDYAAWHTPDDRLDQVSVESLQRAGDVALQVLQSYADETGVR